MSTEDNHTRIDKFLWFVRIFKTRTLAVEACKKGRVLINNLPVKPSRTVKLGEIINVNKPPVIYTYIFKDFPKRRISPKLVKDYIDDVTSPEELKKLEMQDSFFIKRDRGLGRPTKKERRNIDKIKGA
jgi:ribosome-associated heat shock protein Hsp15